MARRDDETRVLTLREIIDVRAKLRERAPRGLTAGRQLVVFDLIVCCGLRCAEVTALSLGDVVLGGDRPYLAVFGKGRKHRRVPLWWDDMTWNDLRDWKAWRQACGAIDPDPFICRVSRGSLGLRMDRREIRPIFLAAIRATLGPERASGLTAHDGRHTFASHAIARRGISAARKALGHSSLATTSVYDHDVSEVLGGAMFSADE